MRFPVCATPTLFGGAKPGRRDTWSKCASWWRICGTPPGSFNRQEAAHSDLLQEILPLCRMGIWHVSCFWTRQEMYTSASLRPINRDPARDSARLGF